MNRRKKKKAFKKRFGFNPPRGISIRTATQIMEHRGNVVKMFYWLKSVILNLWECVKQLALELVEELKEIQVAFITAAGR